MTFAASLVPSVPSILVFFGVLMLSLAVAAVAVLEDY